MKKHGFSKFLLFSLSVCILVLSTNTFAGDINWSGRFNFESQLVKNPNLDTDNEYSFFYHHLILSPKIVAADGINIYSRFDIFNNDSFPNNQFGEFYGGSDTTTTNKANTGELDSEVISVTDLYLTWNQQYGSLILGRTPVHFGLGITHNSGNGIFDHWLDRKDIVGYKAILGNFYFFPMYGKVKEGNAGLDDDIREYLLQVGYENLDTDLEIGFFLQNRKANPGGNDTSNTSELFNVATTPSSGQLDIKTYNLFVKKKVGNFKVAIEGSMQDGDVGVKLDPAVDATEPGLKMDGFAVAGEFTYAPEDSKWAWDLKTGYISGDDAGTEDTYEGYLIDRNYDVALLMFNYMLGQPPTAAGAGNRGILGHEKYIVGTTADQSVDVGYVTNTMYFAPGFNWKWNDKWGMNARFIWAQLKEEQYDTQDDALGYELDLGFYYLPIDKFTIRLDAGYYTPGDAYKGDTEDPAQNFKTDSVYGIFTKAALSF